MEKYKLFTIKVMFFLSFFLVINDMYSMAPGADLYCPTCIKKSLSRSFYDKVKYADNYLVTDNSKNHSNKSGISLDLTAMQQIYQTSDIEYNFTEEEVSNTMDIGDVDLVNAQNFVMPDFDFVEYEVGENADVASSSYYSNFPTATHLQYYDYSEWDEYYYEYYKFSSDKIEIIGAVDVYESVPEINTTNFLVTPLPLSTNTDFSVTGEYTLRDTTYYFEQYIYTEGFGTLQTPDGDIYNTLKIANDYYAEVFVGENVIGIVETYIYTFYCDNGYRLNLYLNPSSPGTGEVDIDYADIEIPSALTSIKEISNQNEFCYPNPATDILNFNKIGNYQIYNSLGTKVSNLENVQNADISNLNSGIYFIKSENGKTQKLIIE